MSPLHQAALKPTIQSLGILRRLLSSLDIDNISSSLVVPNINPALASYVANRIHFFLYLSSRQGVPRIPFVSSKNPSCAPWLVNLPTLKFLYPVCYGVDPGWIMKHTPTEFPISSRRNMCLCIRRLRPVISFGGVSVCMLSEIKDSVRLNFSRQL